MGCKDTKTGVLMKWLVCASIYVLLFGVLNPSPVVRVFFAVCGYSLPGCGSRKFSLPWVTMGIPARSRD